MIPSLLNSRISQITGDSLATIERLGFGHKRRTRPDQPTRDDPLTVVDCPCCGGTVVLAWNRRDDLPEFGDCQRCETTFPYSDKEVYEQDLFDVTIAEPREHLLAAA